MIEASAVIEFSFEQGVCRAVADALRPEVMRSSERFVKTGIEVSDGSLRLRLYANDLADLKAGVNSYVNLVKASSETLSALR